MAKINTALKKMLGDYYYNTGRRPEDLLLYVDGTISLRELNSKNDHRALWSKNKARIFRSFTDTTFLKCLDMAKDQVYRSTKTINGQPNLAYENTWKPRVWMWEK